MADKGISAKEAALIAKARAELLQKPAVEAKTAAASPGAPADGQKQPVRSATVAPVGESKAAPAATAERVAALMAAARAETERERKRRKMLYVWVPFAFMAVTGMTTLLWMWQKL
jgi:hypothetical protein